MSSVKDGTMIILSSPSGAGKTTLTKKISAKDNFTVSISHTTRPPRTNEINGKDYIFVDKDDFNQLIKNNQFLEHAENIALADEVAMISIKKSSPCLRSLADR